MAFVGGLGAGLVGSRSGSLQVSSRVSVKSARSVGVARRTIVSVATPAVQGEVETAEKKPTFTIWNSNIEASRTRPYWFPREWIKKDIKVILFVGAIHLLALAAPFTMSWANVGLFVLMYVITGMLGITMTYHRLLSHRSFKVPKPVEYMLAFCGAMAGQGDPVSWVHDHRHHHKYCDTDQDAHSPYEGFWWSHAGWLVDNTEINKRMKEGSLCLDLDKQAFYKWMKLTYGAQMILQGVLFYLLGGLGGLAWGYAFRLVWVYHITWFVNSASHVWGYQSYNTGDISMNNWWVGILAFGEGWHNNHHAFEYSARHGLEWWQYDPTWWSIRLLQMVGLASNVKLPSEAAKAKLAFSEASNN